MQLTRRFFLQSTGALAMYLGIAPALTWASGKPLVAKRVTKGKTIVALFLRGGADGLNLIVPHGDPNYTQIRKSIALPGPGVVSDQSQKVIDLDGFFGLHPRLAALAPLFASGAMAAAHAVGYDKNTRSHFEEQDTWETGIVGNTLNSDGWLNRHLATSEGWGPIRAVAVGDALPRILHGPAGAFAVRGLEDLVVPGAKQNGATSDQVAAALEHAYCTPKPARGDKSAAMDLLARNARVTLDGVAQLRSLSQQKYEPSAPYPNTGLAKRLMQVARLIKADVGLEVAEVDLGGWDTHQNQGGVNGPFANLAGELGDALAAFHNDLGDRMNDVLVVTMTDFGRTAHENGTGGTDHGWANCMLVMGAGVANAARARDEKQKMIVTNWPGLAEDQLHQKRDLLHTTDFRDVLGEVVRVHLGNENLQKVLPNHTFKPVGLVA
jgi:uncharacterized protein (DUF1501 family)